MYSPRNRHAMITDDSFQIQDWLRSNGNHDRSFPEFDYHHRIRPLSPVKRHRISATDGRGPDRRRQLKSMESLLGLSDENLNGKHLDSEVVTRASPDVQDSLDKALMDFEETLELAFQSNSIVPPPRGFSNHNVFEGDESNFNKLDSSFDSHTTTGSSGYSTKPDQSVHRSTHTFNELQLIREQMAKSLDIIKYLEEQVKMVPLLKAQVTSLTLEKHRLSSELDEQKKMANECTKYTKTGAATQPANGRTATFSYSTSAYTTKDVGVSCTPICRDVGVTTPPTSASTTSASTTSASTMTDASGPEVTTVAAKNAAVPQPVTACTQTSTAAAAVASARVEPDAKITADVGTQSPRPAVVRTTTVGVLAKPRMYDAGVTARPTVKHVGCTAAIDRGAAAEPMVTGPPPLPTVSRFSQTIAIATVAVHARGTQTVADVARRETVNRAAQTVAAPAADRRERTTQTSAAAAVKTNNDHGAAMARPVATTIGRRSNSFHHYTAAATSRDSSPVTSKIPRLKSVTPEVVQNRKVLIRQDTYTKAATEAEAEETHRDSPRRPTTQRVTDDNDVKSKESLSSVVEHENALPESDMNFKPIREDSYKDYPSNEIKGALKVLNDSLMMKKTSATILPRVQLKQAIDVVREEWFKVASSSDCGGHHVKNYVNLFSSYSPVLLEFIINMADAAGNTVMHYAISHGNFDVVATIMDTRVCNVNLANEAGYSSIMLVSLAEIKSEDEMKIIKRLFKSGDVNMQAKKHGQTTLMLAVSHGKIDVVKLLLECGADLNIQDEDGSTALMCAAEHGLLGIVNILLSCPECDVSIADNDGSTALSIAMEAGHKEIGIALYAKQHNIISRENSPLHASKTKRSRSAVTVMQSNAPMMTSSATLPSLKKSPSLQPREYAALASMLKTRIPQ